MSNRSESHRVVETALIILSLLLVGCGKSPEDARRELGELGIEYNIESFFNTVVNNDPLAVELFLIAGIEVNAKNSDGASALHLSTASGNVAITELMLEHGADVDIRNAEHDTPLHLSTSKGYTQITKLILDTGASVKQSNISGLTPLDIAFQSYDTTSVEMLLQESPVSVQEGIDVVYRMWEHAEKQRKARREFIERNSWASAYTTPRLLHVAARENDLDGLRILLEYGVDPNRDLGSALSINACSLLVANGADINHYSGPLSQAIDYGQDEIVQWLIGHGADVNAKNSLTKTTPLMKAVESGQIGLETVGLLIDNGADVNARDANLETPLMRALSISKRYLASSDSTLYSQAKDDLGIVKLLIDHGADVNAKDDDRETPLMKALNTLGGSDIEVIKLLVHNGANVNAKTTTRIAGYGSLTSSILDKAEFNASYGETDKKRRLSAIAKWLKSAGARKASRW